VSEIAKQNDSERLKDMPSGLNRYRSVFLFNWCVA